MLPFLTTLDAVREGKHSFICKLHTKRSPHLRDGDAWRDELVTNLLSPAARVALRTVETMPKIGVLACKGSLANRRVRIRALPQSLLTGFNPWQPARG